MTPSDVIKQPEAAPASPGSPGFSGLPAPAGLLVPAGASVDDDLVMGVGEAIMVEALCCEMSKVIFEVLTICDDADDADAPTPPPSPEADEAPEEEPAPKPRFPGWKRPVASPVAEEAPAPPGRQKITAAMAEEEHTQATYGRLGGMISGLLGPNTFRADYATGGRSKCQRCHTVFVAEEVRVGKVPPRMRADVTAVRVNWYHPACIFQSFERAAKKTKTIDNVEDVAGFEALRDADRADLSAKIEEWTARRARRPVFLQTAPKAPKSKAPPHRNAKARMREKKVVEEVEKRLVAVLPTPTPLEARDSPSLGPRVACKIPCPDGCDRTFSHAPAAVQHGKACRAKRIMAAIDEDEDIRRGPAAFRGAWEARVRDGAAERDALATAVERRALTRRQKDEAQASVAAAWASTDLAAAAAPLRFPAPTQHERSSTEIQRRLVPSDHQHVLETFDRYGIAYRAAYSKEHVQQLLVRRLEQPAPAHAGTGPATQAALCETMERMVTQVSLPDESKYRPGQVVEVPAAAFGEEWAAEHAGETYTGTLLDVEEEDGAILWNVRYGDGNCVTDETFFDEEPDDVCACCGGTTLTTAGEPMKSVLICDACRAEYHLLCSGVDVVPAGEWRCPACAPPAWRPRQARRAEASGRNLPHMF